MAEKTQGSFVNEPINDEHDEGNLIITTAI